MLRFLHKQVNSSLFQIHLIVCLIILLVSGIDNIDLGISRTYFIAAFLLQMFTLILYLARLLYLNTKVMFYLVYSPKTRKELDTILTPSFNVRKWSEFLGTSFSYYEKILILKVFTNRNLFVKRGNQYFYNEDNSLDENH